MSGETHTSPLPASTSLARLSLSALLLLLLLVLPGCASQEWDTQFYQNGNYACANGSVLSLFQSEQNRVRPFDRQWKYDCSPIPGMWSNNCEWKDIAGYQHGRPFTFECDSDKLIAGMASVWSWATNSRNYRVRCCEFTDGTGSHDLTCTDKRVSEGFDGSIRFQVPDDLGLSKVVMFSRRFTFTTCS